jgi:ABC-type glycerol-3-phosphate transport system permease component
MSNRGYNYPTLVLIYLSLIVLGFFFFLPFYWVIISSLKDYRELFKIPPTWFPSRIMWINYPRALTYIPFLMYLKNTIYYCGFSIIGTLLSSSLVAYSLSRVRWRGREILFIFIISTMMIPFFVTMIPLFILFRHFGWINSYKPLIVPAFFGNPFYIFLLRQFFRTIPMDLSDSAKVDGANEFLIYSRIVLPLTKPALTVVVLFEFLGRWNDFTGPLIYLRDRELFPIALGLREFLSLYQAQWSLLMAASAVVTVPIVILFFFTQKTFIEGITFTGLKG